MLVVYFNFHSLSYVRFLSNTVPSSFRPPAPSAGCSFRGGWWTLASPGLWPALTASPQPAWQWAGASLGGGWM